MKETETDFETTVLDGIKTVRSNQDALTADVGRWSKELKTAQEELTALKKNANDVAAFSTQLKRVEAQIRKDVRSNWGNPVDRIRNDDEMRKRFNVAIRLAAAQNGNRQNLVGVARKIDSDLVDKSLTSAATPGSTLITTDLASEIYNVLATYGAWPTLGVQRLGTSTTKFPVTTARPVCLAVRKQSSAKMAEDATIAGTSVDCNVVLWGVLLGAYKELLEDSEYDLTAYILENFAEATAFRMDHVGFVADATNDSADSDFTGMFYAGTTAAAAHDGQTVETMVVGDFRRCLTTVAAVVLQRKARWWMNPTVLARSLAIVDTNGRPMFQTGLEAPSFGGIGSIFGYPITLSGALPTTNTQGSKVAAFGDGASQVFGVRSDFEFESSTDFAFDAAMTYFRGLSRFGTINRAATGTAILTTHATT